MSIKTILTLATVSGIGYQSYTRFKDFINNIKVSTLNFVKNLDQNFTIDLIIANSLMDIIPYKIAEIKLINDNDEIIATAIDPWEIDKTTNIQFLMNIPDALSDISQLRSLDVEITFNFFLFQYVRRYQQTLTNETGQIGQNELAGDNNLAMNELALAENINAQIKTFESYFNKPYQQEAAACNCSKI